MITGFNTDIKYGGVTYHVQTEDKGVDSPLILSLVYVGGAIIASKRTRYEDLVKTGFDEKELTERLQRQHKLICAAIKQGRVEDLKRMAGPNGGAQGAEAGGASTAGRKAGGQRRKRSEPETPAPPAAEPPTAPPSAEAGERPVVKANGAPPVEPASEPAKVVAPPRAEAAKSPSASPAAPPESRPVAPEPTAPAPPAPVRQTPVQQTPAPPAPVLSAPAPPAAAKSEPEIVILATLADEINALEDFAPRAVAKPPAPPAPTAEAPPAQVAVVPVDESAAHGPLLTAEILEEPEDYSDELYLTLLDDEGEFRAGQLATVKVYVGRGAYGQRPAPGASVTVKVLGTSFRPLILTAATDAQGVGVVRALLPRFTSGRAAIIIRASAGEDSAEMRRIIHQ